MKIECDESFEILARNRKQLHQRRTVSSVLDLSNTSLHNKSFSSQLPILSEELQIEIQKIKEESKARYLQQQQRELIFQSILGPDYALQTDEVQIETIQNGEESPKSQEKGIVFLLRSCLSKCFSFAK